MRAAARSAETQRCGRGSRVAGQQRGRTSPARWCARAELGVRPPRHDARGPGQAGQGYRPGGRPGSCCTASRPRPRSDGAPPRRWPVGPRAVHPTAPDAPSPLPVSAVRAAERRCQVGRLLGRAPVSLLILSSLARGLDLPKSQTRLCATRGVCCDLCTGQQLIVQCHVQPKKSANDPRRRPLLLPQAGARGQGSPHPERQGAALGIPKAPSQWGGSQSR